MMNSACPQPVPYRQFQSEILTIYGAGNRATLSKMDQVLREFAPLCESTLDVTSIAISRWLGANHHRAVMTRRSLLGSFRAACTIGAQKSYLANPFDSWDLDRWLPAPDPEDLDGCWLARSPAEISRILVRARAEAASARPRARWRARRAMTLAFLGAYTGARAKELLGAQVRDVDLVNGVFWIRPNARRALKTRPSRRVLPIHPVLLACLTDWLPDTGSIWLLPQKSGNGPWFHGTTGYRPLDAIQQLGERAAVEGMTILSFRHSFAQAAEDWGWSELQLMRWLGHSRPQTQRWYRRRGAPDLLVRAATSIQY